VRLPVSTPAEDISDGLMYISIKQIWPNRRSPTEGATTVTIPLLVLALPRASESQEMYLDWEAFAILQSRYSRTNISFVSRNVTTARYSDISPRWMQCGGGQHTQGVSGKQQWRTDIDIPQLQVGGRVETSSLPLSRLQARQGRNAKQKVAESDQD
jgi:hypothetical protein